jgi:sialate O-acetylesterase
MRLLASLAAITAASLALGDVTLAKALSSNMVVQQGRPVVLWGTADPGEVVKVSIQDDIVTVTTDAAGNWKAELSPREASFDPVIIDIEGKNQLVLRDVLVGEVWAATGQSNMQFALKSSTFADEALAASDRDDIRLLLLTANPHSVRREFSQADIAKSTPDKYMDWSGWHKSNPDSAAPFSAVAWRFAEALSREIDAPIGVISFAVGGTPIEAWVEESQLMKHARSRLLLTDWWNSSDVLDFCHERPATNLAKWSGIAEKRLPVPHAYFPGFMHKAATEHVKNFPIAGMLWYQGESNSNSPSLYELLFPQLIAGFRDAWNQPEMPFLFVQLPGMGTERGYNSWLWPELRQVMANALSIPNTGMACTIDLGSPIDVHPKLKKPVGERLALAALGVAYDRDVEWRGPTIQGTSQNGKTLFLDVGPVIGLGSTGQPGPFEVSLDGKTFSRVAGTASGETILLHLSSSSPVKMVRYAWQPYPQGNVFNWDGLPMEPFRIKVAPPAIKS